MRLLILLSVCSLFSCGCATTELSVQIRTPKVPASPKPERIHFVQSGSLGSGVADPQPTREDDVYSYYTFSSLIHAGNNRTFLVIDFPTGQTNLLCASEVYPLCRTKMRVSDQWSEWITPQFVAQAAGSHDVAFALLYGANMCKTNSSPKTTAMRYTLQYWQH